MATVKKSVPKKKKEDLQPEIMKKIEAALEVYKEVLGVKRFNNRVRKASKVFIKGLPKKTKEQEVKAKKTAPATKNTKTRPAREKKA